MPARFVGLCAAVFLTAVGLLCAAELFEPLAIVPLALWPICTYLDMESTYRIYLQSPEDFFRHERSQALVVLARHLGLPRAFPAFAALVEVPLFAFSAFVVVPLLGELLLGGAGLLPCAGAAAGGFLALPHAEAWLENRSALAVSQ